MRPRAMCLDRLVPVSRWDLDWEWPEPRLPAKRFAGFIDGIELFDAALFGVGMQEVRGMARLAGPGRAGQGGVWEFD